MAAPYSLRLVLQFLPDFLYETDIQNNYCNTAGFIPIVLNPPSWNKFCMVT